MCPLSVCLLLLRQVSSVCSIFLQITPSLQYGSGYVQLATIVQEFFVTNSILDPTTEQRFQQFLSQKATRYWLACLVQDLISTRWRKISLSLTSLSSGVSHDCRSYPKLEGLLDSLLLLYKIAWPFVVLPGLFKCVCINFTSEPSTHASSGQAHRMHIHDHTVILQQFQLYNNCSTCASRVQSTVDIQHMFAYKLGRTWITCCKCTTVLATICGFT